MPCGLSDTGYQIRTIRYGKILSCYSTGNTIGAYTRYIIIQQLKQAESPTCTKNRTHLFHELVTTMPCISQVEMLKLYLKSTCMDGTQTLNAINLVLWCYQSLKVVCRRFVYTTAGIKLHTLPPPSTIQMMSSRALIRRR